MFSEPQNLLAILQTQMRARHRLLPDGKMGLAAALAH
jgi:hypothetical protein